MSTTDYQLLLEKVKNSTLLVADTKNDSNKNFQWNDDVSQNLSKPELSFINTNNNRIECENQFFDFNNIRTSVGVPIVENQCEFIADTSPPPQQTFIDVNEIELYDSYEAADCSHNINNFFHNSIVDDMTSCNDEIISDESAECM